MEIERVSYVSGPERVVEETFDCIWVLLGSALPPKPFANQALQWIDWKLQGAVSRFALGKPLRIESPTYVPTRRRLSAPLLVVEPPKKPDWEAFSKNCEGMGLKRVLVLSDAVERLAELEVVMRKLSAKGIEQVVIGTEEAVGRS